MRTPHLKLAPAVLVASVVAAMGIGCSGDGDEDGTSGANCVSTRQYFQREVWGKFMGTKCAKCHTPDGVAVAQEKAKFVLQPTSYPGFIDANLEMLRHLAKFDYDGQPELLMKPTNKLRHGGGVQLEEGGPEYEALKELINRLRSGDDECLDSGSTLLREVALLDAPATLRKASIDLAGRLPTPEEVDAVARGGDDALDGALDALMREPTFLDRVREIFNDMLLTDRGLAYGGAAIDYMSTRDFPALAPYKNRDDPAYSDPNRRLINEGIAREPLHLIAYVVQKDKPFTEILTADYTVVTPFSAIAYGVQRQVAIDEPNDPNALAEAHVTQEKGPLPHAGVLTTPAFLNRWQTTPTNRDRGRARRVFQFFLATDVLRISDRPIDATKITAKENPTLNSEACTTCHRIIDPVAGVFRGFDAFDYEHFDPNAGWYDDMLHPGFNGEDLDPSFYGRALQWFAPRVVQDPRFGLAVVYAVYSGLTGRKPLAYPTDASSADYEDRLDAWTAQDSFFNQVARDFMANGANVKYVFKAIVKSPYYRGIASSRRPAALVDIGIGQLLSPEQLNRKIVAVTGVHWRKPWEWDRPHDWLLEDYKTLYGGIDSDNIVARATNLNGVSAGVAKRMANEMACRITAWDFTKPQGERRFFRGVGVDTVPEAGGAPRNDAQRAIRENLKELYRLFLDEKLEDGDEELERGFALFVDTWKELSQAGSKSLPWECQGRIDPNTGAELPEGARISSDPNFTIRSWMAVMTYLMSDWKFLYH